jgi:hypothetical protein
MSLHVDLLEQAKHLAQLDPRETFQFVQTAKEAFESWETVRKTDDARLYLARFHLWKRWDEDPR